MKEQITDERRRRIQRLKKIILLLLITSILLPIVLCIILFSRMNSMQDQIEELKELVARRDSELVAELVINLDDK